jgi:hypothetical protein
VRQNDIAYFAAVGRQGCRGFYQCGQ